MPVGVRRSRTLLGLLVGIVAVGCVDERIVFRDRELFEEPPPGAANFVGYTNEETKLTVCGNCHVDHQGDWVGTAHAGAWETLEESGHAQAFCEGCHTVGSLGNYTEGMLGWDATRDTRYYDVQCESCHGPGLEHVRTPDAAAPPLAPLRVDTAIVAGCGECHTGTHHPYLEEWRESGHGAALASPAGRVECALCHTAEDALRSWGVNTNYAEKDTVTAVAGQHLAITCGVCHDPHAKDHEGQLRFPVDAPSEEENLCMKCHHKRGTPDPTTYRGAHSPEGPVLLGYGGWWPPLLAFAGDTILATHGSNRNPKLCAGCHVSRFTVTDAGTGEFQFQVTGHRFEAIPCVDANGAPTGGDCALNQRTFRSCAAVGCHTEAAARGALITVEGRVANLTSQLAAMLAQVPASEFVVDNRYTTAEGARFNQQLAEFPGSAIHNPFLIEALLTASIQQVRQDYGIPAPPGVSLDEVMQRYRR